MRQILHRAALLALAMAAVAPAQESRRQKKLLFLTHSAGYVHDVVKRPAPDQLSFAERELTAIASERSMSSYLRPEMLIQVDCTQDCSVLTAAKLRAYDVVAFYTTGELPAPPGGAQALIEWVRNGGGFVGIHCAADTWYTVPAYGEMVGGVFEKHPWNQEVRVRDELGTTYAITDEIYQFKNFSCEPLSVILTLDLRSVDRAKGSRTDGDYALAWMREYGNGRVFYTALGHGESAWKDDHFRELVRRGLTYASHYHGTSMAREPDQARTYWSPLPPPTPEFTHRDGSPSRWRVVRPRGTDIFGFELAVAPGTGDLISKDKVGDFRLHLEFCLPLHPPADTGQARGNSGVYLQDRYEIQVLDSYGVESKADGCGAIYGKKAPLTNACRKPGEWQSYDVRFNAARFDAAGKKIANARVTAWQNGLKIHDDVEIDGPTGGGEKEAPSPELERGETRQLGPLRLQDHGNEVRYRNIWVVPR